MPAERFTLVAFLGLGVVACVAGLLFLLWRRVQAQQGAPHSPRVPGATFLPHTLRPHLLVLIAIPVQIGILLVLELLSAPQDPAAEPDDTSARAATLAIIAAGLIYVWRRWERP